MQVFFDVLILLALIGVLVQLKRISRKIDTAIEGEELIMATEKDVEVALDALTSQVSGLGNDLTTAIADLEAKITVPPDAQPALDKIKAISDEISNFDAKVKAADPGAATPTE